MAIAHLHSHSFYTFGRATASPASLCSAAARRGVEALALTDIESVHGIPEFLTAAKVHGLHAIVGAALPDQAMPRSLGTGRAVVLARDPAGYSAICRLVTARKAAPRTPLNTLLEGLPDSVWILSPDISLIRAVRRARGAEYLLAELRAGARWQKLAADAEALGVPAVAVSAVQLGDPSERPFQKLLVAVHARRPFPRVESYEMASDRGWMLDEAAMRASFSTRLDAVSRAVDVARDCRVGDLIDTGSDTTAVATLHARVRVGAASRWGETAPAEVAARLERELKVLGTPARAEAMLLAADLAAHARRSGIPVEPTPSVIGSAVAYCLDLGPVDPIAQRLPFAPLCNPSAGGALRLDLSPPDGGRVRLVGRLHEVRGEVHVGRPGTLIRWSLRDAVRDVARTLALRADDCERVLDLLPDDWRGEGPDELIAKHPRLKGAGLDERPWANVLRSAVRLDGVPIRLVPGTGAIVAAGPLRDRVALETTEGVLTAQWDRAAAESRGLLVFGMPIERGATVALRTLARLREDTEPTRVEVLLQESTTPSPEVLLGRLGSLEALSGVELVGVPLLEEPNVRAALRRAPPTSFDALVEACLGVPRADCREDRLAAAAITAGLTEETADQLRRALQPGSDPAQRARMRRRFVEGSIAGGLSAAVAGRLWDSVSVRIPAAPSCATILPRLTAALRALVLQRSAPAAFWAAVLSTEGSAWPRSVHASACRRAGLTLLGPCVQTGRLDTHGQDGVVRIGLERVRGIRDQLAASIVTAREETEFTSMADFLDRVPAGDDEVDVLIASGALDAIGDGRTRSALRILHRHLRPHRGRAGSARPGVRRPPPKDVTASISPRTLRKRAFELASVVKDELDTLGCTISGHPITMVADRIPADVVSAGELETLEGRRVRIVGWPAADDVAGPRLGRGPMPTNLCWPVVYDLEDGLVDATVPDAIVQRLRTSRAGIPRGAVLISGTVLRDGGHTWVDVDALDVVDDLPGSAAGAA
jgi:error-prone DNA polymerase